MKIKKGDARLSYPYVTVHVAPDELDCGQKKYPFATCIGTIRLDTFKINRWSPASYQPRGFSKAAQRALEEIRDGLKAGTLKVEIGQ